MANESGNENSWLQTASDFGRGAIDGITFGQGVKIAAGVKSFAKGTSYDKELEQENLANKQAEDRSPIAYNTGAIGGAAVVPIPGTGIAMAAARGVGMATKVLPKVATAGKLAEKVGSIGRGMADTLKVAKTGLTEKIASKAEGLAEKASGTFKSGIESIKSKGGQFVDDVAKKTSDATDVFKSKVSQGIEAAKYIGSSAVKSTKEFAGNVASKLKSKGDDALNFVGKTAKKGGEFAGKVTGAIGRMGSRLVGKLFNKGDNQEEDESQVQSVVSPSEEPVLEEPVLEEASNIPPSESNPSGGDSGSLEGAASPQAGGGLAGGSALEMLSKIYSELVRMNSTLEKVSSDMSAMSKAAAGKDTAADLASANAKKMSRKEEKGYFGKMRESIRNTAKPMLAGIAAAAITDGDLWEKGLSAVGLGEKPMVNLEESDKLHKQMFPGMSTAEEKDMIMGSVSKEGKYSPFIKDKVGNEKAQKAMKFLQEKGWTQEQAAGIVGNLQQESGNFSDSVVSGKRKGDNGKAVGIAQWHPDRQAIFKKKYGKDIEGSTLEEQLEFLNYELTEGGEKKAGQKIKSTKTASEAAFATDKFYERSAGTERGQRMVNAEVVLALSNKLSESDKVNSGTEQGVNGKFTSLAQKRPTEQNLMMGSLDTNSSGIEQLSHILSTDAVSVLSNKNNNQGGKVYKAGSTIMDVGSGKTKTASPIQEQPKEQNLMMASLDAKSVVPEKPESDSSSVMKSVAGGLSTLAKSIGGGGSQQSLQVPPQKPPSTAGTGGSMMTVRNDDPVLLTLTYGNVKTA